MTEVQQWVLTPKQREFVLTDVRFPCFAGGFGSGKTLAACLRGVLWSERYPGSVGLVGRLTYQELKDTTQKTFLEEALPSWVMKKGVGTVFRRNEGYLKLPNGSEVLFRHLDSVSEFEIRSMNLTWFCIDQAEEIAEEVFLALCGRLRHPVGVRSGWITCNPAMGWIYRRWKVRPDPDTLLLEAKTSENPYLPQGYVEDLRARYPEEWVRRYVECEWSAFEGQIFKEFDVVRHVKEPPPYGAWPPDVEVIGGIDHGLRNPTACVWGMVDFVGRIWVVEEYEREGMIVSAHAEQIASLSKRLPGRVWYVIDPSTHAREPLTGKRVIDEYYDGLGQGAVIVAGNNDVQAGISRIQELLHSGGLCISPSCERLIAALHAYRWKPVPFKVSGGGEMEEKPAKENDHLVDALRYLVMTRPPPAVRPPEGRDSQTFRWWLTRCRSRREASLVLGGGSPWLVS